MENNKTSNFGLELATPGVPLSALVTGNKNLETLDSKAMSKEIFDPPESGQEKGPAELAGGISIYVQNELSTETGETGGWLWEKKKNGIAIIQKTISVGDITTASGSGFRNATAVSHGNFPFDFVGEIYIQGTVSKAPVSTPIYAFYYDAPSSPGWVVWSPISYTEAASGLTIINVQITGKWK